MESVRPQQFVFVLMPFAKEFGDVYQLGIKPACEIAGAFCERVDEQIFQGSILSRVYNQINKADLIVADMTGRNPNVFYEAGYAHALGKKVILLTQDSNDIPFDLKHYVHIVYSDGIAALKEQLTKSVAWYLSEAERITGSAVDSLQSSVELYLGGRRVQQNRNIDLPKEDVYYYLRLEPPEIDIRSDISVFNSTSGTISVDFEIGFVFDGKGPVGEVTRLPDGNILTPTVDFSGSLRPHAWRTKALSLACSVDDDMIRSNLIPVTARVFATTGTHDIPFGINLNPAQASRH